MTFQVFCAVYHSNFFGEITIKSLIYDFFRNRAKSTIFRFLFISLIFSVCSLVISDDGEAIPCLQSDQERSKTRLAWAKDHLHWTPQQWWKVLWSEESKYMMMGTDRIRFVRLPIGKKFNVRYQLTTIKHDGGSCMLWGCFHAAEVGPFPSGGDHV